MTVHDVAVLADFRQPGTASATIAVEVHAQAEAALSTVLIHAPASGSRESAVGFRPRIRELIRDGAATLAREDQPVAARLLVVRRPWARPAGLRLRAERTVLVTGRPPADPAVYEQARRWFGTAAAWAPTSPQAREQLVRAAPGVRVTEADWHELIDVAHWWRDRDGYVAGEPVVGLRGPFPIDLGDLRVRWLGESSPFPHWELVPYGAEMPDEFLRTLDFLVDFHQTFSRSALESMAAGVPVIVGEHLRPFLAGAALYSSPDGVPALVREVYADPGRYRTVVDRAREFAERHYGHRSHLARLARHGIRPRLNLPGPRRNPALGPGAHGASIPIPIPHGASVPTPTPSPGRRLLMLCEGEATVATAIARRLPGGVDAVIVTQAYGAPLPRQEGFLTEYIPSQAATGVPGERWNRLLRDRLTHLIELHTPEVVVVDGRPHEGVIRAAGDHPGVLWVWLRRAWDAGHAGWDGVHVLEPGEFAAPAVAGDGRVHRVDPITLLDPAELPAVAQARDELGLGDGPVALVQPGIDPRVGEHLGRHGFRVVHDVPPARCLRAFDLTVADARYDVFHERLAHAIPTVFVPDGSAEQRGRARFADAAGVALSLEEPEPAEVLDAVVRPEVRAALRRRCAELTFGNGAAAAATWLSGLRARVRG
ncbi:glycosyl transferase [Actinoplanes sp. NPDC049596]|uniref:glycosyl transferase n=1 Tax=unclassified Actinoplanes TaxID=2626549 RepID=UPI0034478489